MNCVLLDEHAAAMHAILVLDDRSAGMETMISAIFLSKRKEEVLRSQWATIQKLVNATSACGTAAGTATSGGDPMHASGAK